MARATACRITRKERVEVRAWIEVKGGWSREVGFRYVCGSKVGGAGTDESSIESRRVYTAGRYGGCSRMENVSIAAIAERMRFTSQPDFNPPLCNPPPTIK